MAYDTIGKMANNKSLVDRLAACAAQEGWDGSASMWAMNNSYQICASPGWAAAWESAVEQMTINQNSNLGERDDVITDGMILSAVQPLLAAETPT